MNPTERKEAILRLGLKGPLAKAEEGEYLRLLAEQDEYLRATGATKTAFEEMLGQVSAPETPKAFDLY